MVEGGSNAQKREDKGGGWSQVGQGRARPRGSKERGERTQKTVEPGAPHSLQKKNKSEHNPKPMSPSPYVLSQLLRNVIVVLDRVEALEGGTARWHRGEGSRSRGRTRDGGSARKLRQIRPTHELPPPRHTRVPSTATWPRAEHVRRPAAHMCFQLSLTGLLCGKSGSLLGTALRAGGKEVSEVLGSPAPPLEDLFRLGLGKGKVGLFCGAASSCTATRRDCPHPMFPHLADSREDTRSTRG